MGKQSIGSYVIAWEKLIINVKTNASEVPGMEVYMPPMEKILEQAKDLSARLEMRRAVKQQEAKERRMLMREGRRQAARMRAALKAHFGINSERLIEFGARPIRPRTGKRPEMETPDWLTDGTRADAGDGLAPAPAD